MSDSIDVIAPSPAVVDVTAPPSIVIEIGEVGPAGPPGPPGPSIDAYTKVESDARFAPLATISTEPPSGGSDGDIWYQVT